MQAQDFPVCTAAIGPMTMAIKAQRALLDAGISAEVRALSPAQTKRGCAYGITFPCTAWKAVRALLSAAGVSVSQYLGKSGGNP